jgi:hypothetical protein
MSESPAIAFARTLSGAGTPIGEERLALDFRGDPARYALAVSAGLAPQADGTPIRYSPAPGESR